jgi:uncharacterized membrane protein
MPDSLPIPAGGPPAPPRTVSWSQAAVAYVVLVAASSSLEGIWYLGIAARYYEEQLGALLRVEFDALVAALFYLVYAAGAFVFALRPALRAASWRLAVGAGAGYGFFCFSAHNLTDLADIRGYSAAIAALDVAWGTCMSAAASTLAYFAARRLLAPPQDP